MIQKIAYHLADFSPRLKSNVRALYQYCPIPMISYPRLENELFCDIYYLRNLCNDAKFANWPILNALKLLRYVAFLEVAFIAIGLFSNGIFLSSYILSKPQNFEKSSPYF